MGQGLVREKNVLTSMVCQRENSVRFCSKKRNSTSNLLLDHSPYSLASEPIFKDNKHMDPNAASSQFLPPQSTTVKDNSHRSSQHHAYGIWSPGQSAQQPYVPKIARQNVWLLMPKSRNIVLDKGAEWYPFKVRHSAVPVPSDQQQT